MKQISIIPKVYKLYNGQQNYDWGTKNKNAFIPNFVGDEIEKDLPYAELWIGAHPKMSSKIKIDDELVSLEKIISKFPKEFLGKLVAKRFKNKLPFLLKILSADRALSIQTHPDKKTAKILHKKDPKNYPDDNHKPEIAIAIDGLKALVGFKSYKKIVKVLTKYPELAKAVNHKVNKDSAIIPAIEDIKFVKNIYAKLMKLSDATIVKVIHSILERIKKQKNLTKEETEFIKQYNNFRNDLGLISILLFNYLELGPNEAIFTGPGIPHAYLKGNIIECMANSDNVVRAGLTEKYKDVKTLLSILKYDNSGIKKMKRRSNSIKYTYPISVDEFSISLNSFLKQKVQVEKNNSGVKIILVMLGSLNVEWKEDDVALVREFKKGESFLIPGNLKYYKLKTSSSTKFIKVEVPE